MAKGKVSRCPACGQVVTARSEHISAIAEHWARDHVGADPCAPVGTSDPADIYDPEITPEEGDAYMAELARMDRVPESVTKMLWKVGDRVRLVSHTDSHSKLQPGTLGTIRSIDDLQTVHVNWDNGSTLGLIPGVDHWERVR